MPISTEYFHSTFGIVTGFIETIPEQERTPAILEHVRKAETILADAKFAPPTPPELECIVVAAFKAFEIYVQNGVEQRDPEHWERFFRRFSVICCRQHAEVESRKWNVDQVFGDDNWKKRQSGVVYPGKATLSKENDALTN